MAELAVRMRQIGSLILLLCLSACASQQTNDAPAIPEHGVIGVESFHLDPAFWIRQQRLSEREVLDPEEIAAQNAKLFQVDASMNDLERLPQNLARSQIREWIDAISARPEQTLYDESGREVTRTMLDELVAATNRDAIDDQPVTRYGMVVRRADLRTFPTRLRVFRSPDDSDIDRFQESGVFPGTPVVITHESTDGEWLFVVTPRYEAWIERRNVAEGERAQIFGYMRKTPYLVVTGSTVRTVFTQALPEVSELQLDMGVRVPLLSDWPADRLVNGQHPYASHVVELPVRGEEGRLHFAPALVPRTADVATSYLPYSDVNLVRQSFKFLGERYGWGHSFNARDCSGFVSEVYRSFGIQMPRNTRDQGTSSAFQRIDLAPSDTQEKRLEILRSLKVGDLIYIPGHVMMVIGYDQGMPYVIHDTTGIAYRKENETVRVQLNGVSVTPLMPLLLSEERALIDQIYSIQRIR